MEEKKIQGDIKANLDTSEAERKAGTLTENIRTRIKQLQKGVEEYQYHTERIAEGARDPGRMEWTEAQERRIKGTHEYIKTHLTDIPKSLKKNLWQGLSKPGHRWKNCECRDWISGKRRQRSYSGHR